MPATKTSPVVGGMAADFSGLTVDPATGRAVHGGIPALGPPTLGSYLETHGQAVPGILKSPFRPIVPQEVDIPPEVAEAMHHQTGTDQEQTILATAAQDRGGRVIGSVPMSFMSSPANPHITWLFPPSRR